MTLNIDGYNILATP